MYFFSLSIFESAILLSFSVLTVTENRNSSGQYVFHLNVFLKLQKNMIFQLNGFFIETLSV